MLLFSPRTLFVLEQGWTELFAICWLGAAVYAACRGSRFLPLTIALLVSSKQHLLLAGPLALLLVPSPVSWRSATRMLGPAILLPFLLAAPFFLWAPRPFLQSVVLLQFKEQFRRDSLSLLGAVAHAGWPIEQHNVVLLLAPMLALAAGLFFVWQYCPRDVSGYSAALGFVLLLVFLLSKKAFANYYYFVLATLCAAAATAARGADWHHDRPGG
jgi:hypothetical protein